MSCTHRYEPSVEHPGYERCVTCGTYHSLAAPPPEEVYSADYWSHERGHSTLAEQIYNVESHLENGVSKNQFVLNLIDVEDRTAALEIGCAPGALLGRLKREAGFRYVSGVEMVGEWLPSMKDVAGCPCGFWFGPFPRATKDVSCSHFSLIVACDVWEHSHEPEAFLAECARLLKPGGQLILMMPMLGFGEMPERMWNPQEHVYLHHEQNLGPMLAEAGFPHPLAGKWCAGHDTISVKRRA